MLTTFVRALMSADADVVCGADLAIPKMRESSYFPDWLWNAANGASGPHLGGRDVHPLEVSTRRMEILGGTCARLNLTPAD